MGNTFSCPCPRGKGSDKLAPVQSQPGQVVVKNSHEAAQETSSKANEGIEAPSAVQTTESDEQKKKPYRCLEVDVSDKNANLFFRIMFWASPDKLWWAGAYTSLCFNSIIGASQPKLFTDVVTSIRDPTSGAFLFAVSRLTAISFLLTATGVGNSVCFSEASFRLNMRLKKMVLCNVLQQEMGFFDSTTAGDLITQIGSTGGVCAVVNKMIPTAIRGTLTVGTAFYFLSLIDIRLALITFVGVPTELGLSYFYAKQFEKYSEEVQECNARTGTCIQETMHGIKAIRPLHAEERQSTKFMRLIGELRKLQLRQRRILAGQTVFSTVLPHATGLMILCYGAHLVMVGAVPATAIITVTMYQSTLQSSMGSLMSLYVDWRSMIGGTRKVIKYLDRVPEGKKRGTYIPRDRKLKGHIEVRNISFAYPNNPKRKILSNITLDVAPGGRLALVGPSGGGKSSLVNMMMGIYDPDEGEVLVDGIPISEYDPQFLYTKGMSSVYQTPTLFKCSVRENITFGMGDKDVTEDEIIAAAKAANAHEFIMQLPKGYDTDLGLDGGKLSGGQRQRISIARAIVRNPSILLLDEPTSALDNRCEYAVKEALLNVMEGRTVIVVAHRLTTIQNFERIVVMENGKFVEDGNHQDLINNGGLYFTLAAGIFAEEAKKNSLEKARAKVQK